MFGNIFKKDQEDTAQSPAQASASQQGIVQSPAAGQSPPQAPSTFSTPSTAAPPMDSSMQQPSPVNQTQQQSVDPFQTSATPTGSDVPQDVIPQSQGPLDSTPPAQQYGDRKST